jgi:hypothetical protein
MESGCYFLKATDTPERLQPLMSDFYTLVGRFAISATTGKPEMQLPDGWSMNPRDDIAMAEFIAPESMGNVKFTVTVLAMPPAEDWQGYLLSNINRWRGQLGLPDLDSSALTDELISVDRPGSLLPGYLFDAVGKGSGTMGGSGPPRAQPAPARTQPTPSPAAEVPANTTPQPVAPLSTQESQEAQKPELQYETPQGWELSPGSPFRLATFRVASADGEGEVTVSMAVDNPMANAMMWHQQVTREADETKIKTLAEASIASALPIPSGTREGILYTIRDSEQLDAPVLWVASIPTDRPDLHLFVKMRGDNRFAQAQRDPFFQFVQSLSLK